ncbi:contact-dependent growth inhibition system immunity protein [Saccharopolyspora shandongensis]|uniref:contact-dependent growth inhibition system immunity protein n=1 Tax=Saccharopolyspora shandongensis TaxID=418495 RepID=UPI003412AAE4
MTANAEFSDDQSLEQIEGDAWGEPAVGATKMMVTVYRLRHTPIGALPDGDLRILVGQRVGLDVLMPRVLARLEQDPLLEGDFYEGDVLAAVLRIPANYWAAKPEQRARVERIITAVENPDSALQPEIDTFNTSTRR